MIFWATVLAFVLGIMYYMIYPYDTKISPVYLPASEAYIASFLAQHQAAKDYSREAVIAINHLTDTLPKQSSPVENSILILSNSDPDKSYIDSFLPSYIASVQTSNFRPAVSSSSSGELDIKDGFVSVLACFNRPERKLINSEDYAIAELTGCKAATTKYVMTYGLLPNELDRPYMRDKTLLWEAALIKRTRGNPDCGFLYYDRDKNRYFINNSRHLTRTIPNAFARLLGTSYFTGGDNDSHPVFVGENQPLLFCMTPVNDPYPRLGLKVLLDGTINTLPSSESGSPDKEQKTFHSVSIIDNKWINLANEKSLGIEAASSGNILWNTYCSVTSESCHADGFSFSKNRSVIVVPADSAGSNENLFGMPVTISFMALFNGGTYPVFKSLNEKGGSDCTPSESTACVAATYGSNNLTINITRKLPAQNKTLTALVPAGTFKQIDYVLNAKSHKLYVDGRLAGEVSFGENDVAFIAGNSFELGGNGADYILYNFLVYNRSPENGADQAYTKFDLYGLPRIYKSNTLRYIKKTEK